MIECQAISNSYLVGHSPVISLVPWSQIKGTELFQLLFDDGKFP